MCLQAPLGGVRCLPEASGADPPGWCLLLHSEAAETQQSWTLCCALAPAHPHTFLRISLKHQLPLVATPPPPSELLSCPDRTFIFC